MPIHIDNSNKRCGNFIDRARKPEINNSENTLLL